MTLTFIGGGNMAAAMIGGLIAKGWQPRDLCAVDILPEALARLQQQFGVRTSTDGAAAIAGADAVVLAVKPQQMREVAQSLAVAVSGQLFISIAAGIRSGDLQRWLGGKAALVRAMPNTPALVSAGIAGLYASPGVSDAQRTAAENILGAVGDAFWVNEETGLDVVTAVSGSGPAYVFYCIEALEQAAIAAGQSADAARRSALATFAGAVKLALADSADPATLRARVTSKGGTTERGIAALEAAGLRKAFADAVQAAAQRSVELGDTLGRD